MKKLNQGFSLIEIIVSIALVAIIFSFMFYFVSSINQKNKIINKQPYMMKDYNYSDKHCYFIEGQMDNISLKQSIDMSLYISTSTPITSINIFNKNKLIITTNSASTTESDIFIFSFSENGDTLDLNLLHQLDVGPGINDGILHDNFFYVLNTSVNSHVKSFKLENENLVHMNEIKINKLSASYALAKRIYLFNNSILIGSEKNSTGGELFLLPLNTENFLTYPTRSIEINGQVSGIHINQGLIYIANASDIELFVYDKDFNKLQEYDAPLSLGNGKAVYILEPYIYLGRTVASFELFLLEIKDSVLNYINKFKLNGSIDFIQPIGKDLLFITSAENKELQFFDQDLNSVKKIDIPGRVLSYNCFENSFLFSTIINNQPNILWLK
jgi:prepilin-type N-terminal cleavage/methylation domain-containing protein